MIQKVQDTVIHLEVDAEQWEITQGSKRQTERTGFLGLISFMGVLSEKSATFDTSLLAFNLDETKSIAV